MGRRDGPKVRAFLETYLRHSKGRWRGLPLALEDWQIDFVDEAFSVDGRGRRIYEFALLGEPRKNGKSTLAAGLGLELLLADGENAPEVYALAAAKDQARAVFEEARRMALASPKLLDYLRVQRNDIVVPDTDGVYRVLSADAPLQHGLNPSAATVDEYHAHKTDELLVAMTTATGARECPLTLVLTTAGHDTESPLGRLYTALMESDHAERVTPYLTIVRDRQNGVLAYWYGAPDDADPDDPEVWRGANPASWITEDYLRRQRNRPDLRLNDFRRFHLNQWTEAEDAWITASEWDACAGDPLLKEEQDQSIYVGVDFAQKRDHTAIVWAAYIEDRLHVRQHFLKPTEKRPVSTLEVGDFLDQLARKYDVVEVAYDPYRMNDLAERLEEAGLRMVEFPQSGDARMGQASETLYRLIREGRVIHDGSSTLRAHALSAVARETEGGWRLSKRQSTKHIDGVIALAIAAQRASDDLSAYTGPLVEVFG